MTIRLSEETDVEVLRKRVALLQRVLDGVGLGVAFCDDTGSPEFNPAAVAVLGNPKQGKTLIAADGLTPISWADLPLERALRNKEAGSVEFHVDSELLGSRHQMLCTAWPLLDDDDAAVTGAVAILEDITLRERALAELAESEVALSLAARQATSANEAKSDFLATMSHEIRTPMNGIIGMAEMLTTTPLDAQQREFADLLLKSADHLLLLINDILDFSKVEAGEMQVEHRDFNMLTMVSDVVKLLSPSAQAKGIALSYSYHFAMPREINSDETKLRQILINLVSNAIKFTEQGEVCIGIDNVDREGEHSLHMEVRDSGIGIAPSLQQVIFDAFRQADSSTTRKHGGTGLGLAICRRYSELLGGSIEVSSTKGGGSTFSVEVPYKVGSTNSVAQQPADLPQAGLALRVLVVEDNPVNQKVILHQLEKLGHQAKLAQAGPEAIEHFTVGQFDIVLMDWSLPGMNGIEVTRRLRMMEQQQEHPPTHIVGYTANVLPEHRESCTEAGMDDFLAKPCNLVELAQALSKVGSLALPVLNKASISELQSLSDDPNFLAEMITVFLSDAAQSIADLRSAARDDDSEAAATLCHRLKSTSRSLGVDLFAAAATAMEERCRTSELTESDWLESLGTIDETFAAASLALQSL